MSNNNTDFDKEVQARVDFKMNEFLTGVKNMVSYKYRQAFDMTQKSQYIWQAWEELEKMFQKEVRMGLPYDSMVMESKREAKNKAVDKIMNRLDLNGRIDPRERQSITRTIVSSIEEAQNY